MNKFKRFLKIFLCILLLAVLSFLLMFILAGEDKAFIFIGLCILVSGFKISDAINNQKRP